MEKLLIEKAKKMLKFSYSPYSDFKVGAALLSKSGKIYTGCNVENAAYSVTSCAERTALNSAISKGERNFEAIAIVGGKNGVITQFCYPCGVCRQALSEFCDEDFKIILYNGKDSKILTLSEILPKSFRSELNEHK